MSKIRGFVPPPETMPAAAREARLVMDNARMRNALVQVIAALEQGRRPAVVIELARNGLRGAMA